MSRRAGNNEICKVQRETYRLPVRIKPTAVLMVPVSEMVCTCWRVVSLHGVIIPKNVVHYNNTFYWVPFDHHMARSQVADGADDLQLWRVA
jgi:hypothetical protein